MMNLKMLVPVIACSLALAACGNNNSSSSGPAPAATTATPAATAVAPMTAAPTTTGVAAMPAPSASAPGTSAANGKPAAVVTNCSTEIEGTDAMQYSVSSITVPASCTTFKITLKHTGNLPVAAMGHDVVITRQSDMEAVDKEGAAAGLKNGYIKADDPRIIAHTKLIGGGQTTSVSFPVSKIKSGGPYVFFCSFPGHSATMHGPISVE